MFSRSLVILAVVGVCYAAVWQGRPPQKPKEFAHKQGCYVQEINDVIAFGTEVTPIGYCYRISCNERMMYYDSCGVVSTDDPTCYITGEDLSVPYPQCCSTVKCEEDNRI